MCFVRAVFGKFANFGAGDTFGDDNVFGKGATFGPVFSCRVK